MKCVCVCVMNLMVIIRNVGINKTISFECLANYILYFIEFKVSPKIT